MRETSSGASGTSRGLTWSGTAGLANRLVGLLVPEPVVPKDTGGLRWILEKCRVPRSCPPTGGGFQPASPQTEPSSSWHRADHERLDRAAPGCDTFSPQSVSYQGQACHLHSALGFHPLPIPSLQFTQLLCSGTPALPLNPGHLLIDQAPSFTLRTPISRTRPWATLLVPRLPSER